MDIFSSIHIWHVIVLKNKVWSSHKKFAIGNANDGFEHIQLNNYQTVISNKTAKEGKAKSACMLLLMRLKEHNRSVDVS